MTVGGDDVSWTKNLSLMSLVPDWEVRRSSPSLEKSLLNPDRDEMILFITQGTY